MPGSWTEAFNYGGLELAQAVACAVVPAANACQTGGSSTFLLILAVVLMRVGIYFLGSGLIDHNQ